MAAAVAAAEEVVPAFASAEVDFSAWAMAPVRANEKGEGKSVPFGRPSGDGTKTFSVKTELAPLPLAFPIRPSGGDDGKVAFPRLNMELRVPRTAEYAPTADKARALDTWLMTKALAANRSPKTEFWAGKSRDMARYSDEMAQVSLSSLYNGFVREGKARNAAEPDGERYDDGFRFKVDGWNDFIAREVKREVMVRGKKTLMTADCEWRPRLVEAGPLGDRDTVFWERLPSGKYTNKKLVLTPTGARIQIGTKDGKPQYRMRWVGPGDVTVGSMVTAVVCFSKMYVAEKFGPSVLATQVYFTPAPPKARARVRGKDEADLDGDDGDELFAAQTAAAAAAAAEAATSVDEVTAFIGAHGGAHGGTATTTAATSSGGGGGGGGGCSGADYTDGDARHEFAAPLPPPPPPPATAAAAAAAAPGIDEGSNHGTSGSGAHRKRKRADDGGGSTPADVHGKRKKEAAAEALGDDF